MSYHDRLNIEINAKLDALAADKRPWVAKWIAHSICGDHEDGLGDGDDALFWRHCGYEEVRDQVRRCINKRAGDRIEEDAAQPKLPGYEHVHAYYLVSRDGEEIAVPTTDLTDDEIGLRAAQYRSMGAACFAHADELDRFKRTRTAPPLFAEPVAEKQPA